MGLLGTACTFYAIILVVSCLLSYVSGEAVFGISMDSLDRFLYLYFQNMTKYY